MGRTHRQPAVGLAVAVVATVDRQHRALASRLAPGRTPWNRTPPETELAVLRVAEPRASHAQRPSGAGLAPAARAPLRRTLGTRLAKETVRKILRRGPPPNDSDADGVNERRSAHKAAEWPTPTDPQPPSRHTHSWSPDIARLTHSPSQGLHDLGAADSQATRAPQQLESAPPNTTPKLSPHPREPSSSAAIENPEKPGQDGITSTDAQQPSVFGDLQGRE
jgi:hypothetical protein